MSTFKKIMHFLSTVLIYSIVSLLVIVAFMFIAYFIDQRIGASKGEKRGPLFGAYVIISNSMVPNINVYDAVVTARVKTDKLKVNDIITFISKDIKTAGTPITHRIVGIVHEDGDSGKVLGYRTKGDHNNTEDFALIAPDEVLGKVMFRIPLIGYLQMVMTNPIGWILLVVIPCLLIIGSDVMKLIKAKDENNPKQEIAEKVVDQSKETKISETLNSLDDVFELKDEEDEDDLDLF